MANHHHHALLCEKISQTFDSFTVQSRQMRGQQAYPTNETNSIGWGKMYILQSIDAMLVCIVTNRLMVG
jgi:hypothetical protein